MKIFFVCVILFLLTPLLFADSLADLLNSFQSMSANFSQVTVNQDSHLKRHAQGTVVIAKPNRFRWSVTAPNQQLYVSDGKTIWTYEPALSQVIVRSLSQSFTGTPLLLLSGEVKNTLSLFTVKALTHESYLLTPKPSANNLIKWVKLSFAGKTISTMTLENTLGQKTTVMFSNVKMNPHLSPDLFTFVPPQGTDVLHQ